MKITGSELYHSVMDTFENDSKFDDELMHKVWDGTPWIVNAYTGNIENTSRYYDIQKWCRENFGDEAWPIHGEQGDWHRGGATIQGWTWMGFKTKEMMDKFIEKWPSPEND